MNDQINEKLKLWSDEYRENINRLSWDEYFILQAYLVSLRSMDAQTQCGCVLTKQNKTIVSTGYNSFISQIDDFLLPNLRPEKYDFFIHAEHNAILNAAKNGVNTSNCIAYITTTPCINCFQYLHQAGITKIVYYNNNQAKMTLSDDQNIKLKILKSLSKIETTIIPQSIEFDEKIKKITSLRPPSSV